MVLFVLVWPGLVFGVFSVNMRWTGAPCWGRVVVQEMLSHPRTFLALYRPETLNILWEFEQSEPRFRSFHGWAMLPCWLGWWPLESSRRWRSPLTRTEKLSSPATQQSIYKTSRKCLFLFAQRLSSQAQDGNTNSHIAYWQKYQPDIY